LNASVLCVHTQRQTTIAQSEASAAHERLFLMGQQQKGRGGLAALMLSKQTTNRRMAD
jgi:hypothetical protein